MSSGAGQSQLEGHPERDCTESDEIKIVKKETRIRPQIFTATSALPTPLSGFRPFRHQVGGHLKVEENPCFMLDEEGILLKLLEEKSLKEKAFYEKIFMEEPDNNEWSDVKKYLPTYYGSVNLSNGSEDLCYLKMDNLIGHFKNPCIMDLKIGKKTFDPFAGPDKIQRELIRYKYQAQLGFRITGFKVFKASTGKTELYDRFHCKGIKPDDIVKTFVQFFDLEEFPERQALVIEMVRRLRCLLKWFEKQKRIKFFRTSLLIAYEGSMKMTRRHADVERQKNSRLEDLNGIGSRENIYHLENKLKASESLTNPFKKLGLHDIISNTPIKERDCLDYDSNQVVADNVGINMIDFAHTFCDVESMSSTLDENYMFGLRSAISHLERTSAQFST